MKKNDLIEFEDWCVDTYKKGELKSPLHLSGNNEDELIALFKNIKPNDWVFSTYRSHYHSLLKGVNPEWLKNWVRKGYSIHVMNKEHKIFTSAIVGGQLSPALGVAMGIKMKHALSCDSKITSNQYLAGTDKNSDVPIIGSIVKKPHVWVFCGDMCAEMGIFHEVSKYARRNNLPITFIVEDNELACDTPTQETWGKDLGNPNVYRYKYIRNRPHYGIGEWVTFK